jgi:hypothetical protein
MPAQLSLHAIDKSTYIIIVSFTNEQKEAVTPKSVKWTLTDSAGNIINSRSEQVETPASSVGIVLFGLDLEHAGDGLPRVVTVKAIYDSVTYGNDLPIKGAIEFLIDNLIAVPSSSQSPSASVSPSVSASPSPSA